MHAHMWRHPADLALKTYINKPAGVQASEQACIEIVLCSVS